MSGARQSVRAAILFANGDWLVRPDGLEHRGNGYFVAREELHRRHDDGLWVWPLHLAEKAWCAPKPLADALTAALDAYGIRADAAYSRSLALARLRHEELARARARSEPEAIRAGAAFDVEVLRDALAASRRAA
jgi:hypothetical protein